MTLSPMRAAWLAVLAARRVCPDLQMTLTPNTNGRAWLVDACCSTIYLHDGLPAEATYQALADALAALAAVRCRTEWDHVPFMPLQRSRTIEPGLAPSG